MEAKYGPINGIFTDGGCTPNPGRGSWVVLFIRENELIQELSGKEHYTTSNRMEMTAIIEALRMVPNEETITIYSDSQLCINTLNSWAIRWEQNGWKRHKRMGEIKNLDLVKEAFKLKKLKNKVTLQWIKGHSYSKWNDYANIIVKSLLNFQY